jgi:uncharacterized protein (DUF1800 family)
VPDLATRDDIARLFARAAFGATGADHDKWDGKPYADVVNSLFPPGPPGAVGRTPQEDEAVRAELEHGTTDIASAQRWWLDRMRTTPYPIEERVTLFWHDHFATAYTGQPDVGDMMIQNQTLRTYGLGSFRDLANAMLVDPALLIWLNGIANTVNGVNENLAREFMELFSLGVVPQVYTETDIRQAAKVLTGFTVNTTTRASAYTAARHDRSVKTVLGRTIGGYAAADTRNNVEYKELTEAVLAHDGGRTTSRFLAYKLLLSFGYQIDPTRDITTDPLLEHVAASIRADDRWDISEGVRQLLLHPLWRYADAGAGRQLVRSPIELVVHGAKVMGVNLGYPSGQLQAQQGLASANRAGQAPFSPPNVGGWPNGVGWLSQTTTLGRYDMFNNLVTAYRNQRRDSLAPMPPSGDIDYWSWYMGLHKLSTSTRLRLQEYLAAPGTTVEADKQASMFILVGSSPDWQVV